MITGHNPGLTYYSIIFQILIYIIYHNIVIFDIVIEGWKILVYENQAPYWIKFQRL